MRLLFSKDRKAAPADEAQLFLERKTSSRLADFPADIRTFFSHNKQTSSSGTFIAIYTCLILALVLIVYRPVLPGHFLMDDHRVAKDDNGLVNGQFTPLTIWFRGDFTLSSLGFWLESRAWDENPAGYHVVNIILHGLSAVLLWRLLVQLKIPGAWLAGVLFALHPVCVNSVARIAELKNTLSLPFFLLSILAYLRYETISLYPVEEDNNAGSFTKKNATAWYVFSLIAFLLALLSKTSTVMLPVVLLACAWWQRGRIARRDLVHTLPHFILALAFGLMSIWFQKHQALAECGQVLPPETFSQRIILAGNIFCFYLEKAFLPFNLNLVYPVWKAGEILPVLYLLAIVLPLIGIICWRFQLSWGRHLFFGLGCFAVMLFPALGFFDSQFLTKWQVSDHLQYLPLIAPVALLAAALALIAKKLSSQLQPVFVILLFGFLAHERAGVFASQESLMRDTLAKNPAAADAYNDLGVCLAQQGKISEATTNFTAAVTYNPDNSDAQLNLGQALSMQRNYPGAEVHFLAILKADPANVAAHKKFADTLAQEGRFPEAINQLRLAIIFELKSKPDVEARDQLATLLRQTGQLRQAMALWREAVALQPQQPEVLNNMAWVLATCSDDTIRDGAEAVRCAEQSCSLTGYKQSLNISTLAAAYAEAGRFPEAIKTAQTALQMQTESGQTQFAAYNRQLIALYETGRAFHERPAPAESGL